MNSPKVSILVPSFNQGAFITNLIKSALGQSYENWEMIIQDGGSTDNTATVCKSFAASDSRIVFQSEKDKGFSDAVNKAIDRALGSIAIIQSSDDFFATPDAIGQAVSIFVNDPRLVLVGGSAVVVDDKLLQLGSADRDSGYIRPDLVYQLVKHFSQSATFFSLERARRVGKLDVRVDMVADTDFWIRMACYHPAPLNTVLHTTQTWGCVMVQPNQRSADFSKFYKGRAKMFMKFIEDDRIRFSPAFKRNVAEGAIKAAINHFTQHQLATEELTTMYKELHGQAYVAPSVSWKGKIFRMIRGSRNQGTPRSIQEMYLGRHSESPLYNCGWFNSHESNLSNGI